MKLGASFHINFETQETGAEIRVYGTKVATGDKVILMSNQVLLQSQVSIFIFSYNLPFSP